MRDSRWLQAFSRRAWVVAVAFIGLTVEVCPAADEHVIARLPLNRDATLICVAGTIDGTPQNFVIDTGSTHCCYPSSRRKFMGRAKGEIALYTIGGNSRVKLFEPPNSRIGAVPLHRDGDLVINLDFDHLSDSVGVPIGGIIGMDFLRRHIVEIDFDNRELKLRRQLPNANRLGARLSLAFEGASIPSLPCKIGGNPCSFRIDTGSDITAQLTQRIAMPLYTTKKMRAAGLGALLGPGRPQLAYLLRCDEFSIGEFAHSGLVFSMKHNEHQGDSCLLGMNYLRRFNIVFDFPNQHAYLTKSSAYDKKDYSDIDGMELVDSDDGRVLVHRLVQDGRADRLGIRSGDELVMVDGERLRHSGQAYLRIGRRGKQVKVQFRRAGAGLYSVTLPY